jgi:hypothetical protein
MEQDVIVEACLFEIGAMNSRNSRAVQKSHTEFHSNNIVKQYIDFHYFERKESKGVSDNHEHHSDDPRRHVT